MIRPIRFAALALLSTTLAVSPLSAQTIYGGLRGLVTDSSGAAMSNAKVSLTNEGTADLRSAMTSTTGEYAFTQITPGKYKISVEFSGFKKYERAGMLLETQQQLTVDIKMEVGNVNESVQVTEEVPLIETANASQGQVIDRQKLIDLPNLGRNPYMFSRLAPNVQQVGNPAFARMQDQSGSSMISIAGGPVRGNNYLLDGVAITDMGNRAIIIASLESVQEMKIQANTYDSEIGRSGGGMFNALMKSGTNGFHGSGGAYFRQTDWLANSFFSNRAGVGRTDQPFKNYLGSFGGPVWIPKVYDGRNKTFFFVAAEGYRDTQANAGATQVPTVAERSGDFSRSLTAAGALRMIYDPLSTTADGVRTAFSGNIIPANRISAVGRNIAATFPDPDLATRFHGDSNKSYAAQLASVADQRTLKVDHKMASWWNASFGFQWYHSLEPGETWFPDKVSSPDQWRLDRIVHSSQLNNTITLNPTTVLAVRYGFNRFPNYGFQLSQGFNPTSLGFSPGFVKDVASLTFPNVSYQNFYTGFAMGTNNNFLIIPYSKNFGTILSKFMGKHSLKFGVDTRRINMYGADFGNSSGEFGFTDNFTRANYLAGDGGRTGSDLASLLLGAPNTAAGFVPKTMNQYLQYYSGFFQDDFRFNSKLTVNLGLRWERESGLREVNDNLIVGFNRSAVNSISRTSGFSTPGAVMFAGVGGAPRETSNPEQNKLSPRFGVAYQLNSKTTLRGGYGIFWGPQIAQNGPYLPEGFTARTETVISTDSNRTPAANLSTIFSGGLDKPVGSGLGDRTGIGKALTIFDQNARAPRIQQFSLDIQRELPFGIAASIAYVGSRSTHITQTAGGININQVEPGFYGLGTTALAGAVANPYFGKGGANALSGATVQNAQLLRPFPGFGNLTLAFSDYNYARYDSMVLKAQKRMSKGVSFLVAWTWSKNYDLTSGGAGNNLNGGNVSPQNVYDLKSEYGLSYLDATHRLSQTWTYELPFGKGRAFAGGANRITDMLIGGWSMNAVSVINSGFPLQIRQNNNNNSIIFASSQRPNATGVNPLNGGTKAQWIDGPAGNAYLTSAAFSNAPALTFGNTSRTISTRALRQVNWDMSMFKNFTITERVKAQFRAEALNAMNTPFFRAPNTAVGSGSFGKITAQANFPRFIQLGFRVSF